MITVLLAPLKKKSTIVPNIEVIGKYYLYTIACLVLAQQESYAFRVVGNPSANSEDINETSNDNGCKVDENTNGDEWYMHQSNPTETISLLSGSPKYGFANKISAALASFDVYHLNYKRCVSVLHLKI